MAIRWFQICSLVLIFGIAASAQGRTDGTTPVIAVQADRGDEPASTLRAAVELQLRQSVRYTVAKPGAPVEYVIHLVGLSIPGCRPSSAVAATYVAMPTGRHLGTTVVATDPARLVVSARDLIGKLPPMIANARQ